MTTLAPLTEQAEFKALLPWAKALAQAAHADQLDTLHVLQAARRMVEAGTLTVPPEVRGALEKSVPHNSLPSVHEPVQAKMPLSTELKAALARGAADGFASWLGDLLGLNAAKPTSTEAAPQKSVAEEPEYLALRPWLHAAMRSLGHTEMTLPALAMALHSAIAADALADHAAFAHWCEGHLDELQDWLTHKGHSLGSLTPASDGGGEVALNPSFTQALAQVNVKEHMPSAIWKWVHAVVNAANEDNRRLQVAYHEAGHAVALHVLSPETVYTRITIKPEGDKGGYVASDRSQAFDQVYLNSLEHAMETVVVCLAGRAAEVARYGSTRADSGAVGDMHNATMVTWLAITAYGLDPDFGLLSLASPQKLATKSEHVVPMAPQGWLQDLAQQRLHAWLRWGMQEAEALIKACWPLVERLALALMERQTLDNAQAREILGRWRAGAPPYSLKPVPSSLTP